MRINSIYLKNYRGISEKRIHFHAQFTVLIGDNASGKTTFMDALSFALGRFIIGLDNDYQSPKSDPWFSIKNQDVRISKGRSGNEWNPRMPSVIEAEGDLFEEKNIKWGGERRKMDEKSQSVSDKGAKEIGKKAAEAQRKSRSEDDYSNIVLPLLAYFGPGRLGAEHQMAKKKASDEGIWDKPSERVYGYKNCLSVKSSGKIFKSWFKTLQANIRQFNRPADILEASVFRNTITEIVPQWKEIGYDFKNDDFVGFFEKSGQTVQLPFESLSNGYQNFIGIIADLVYRCIRLNPHLEYRAVKETPGVVLIDEIDLHLHPNWQKDVVGSLKRAFPKIQFIATTHSPFIIQSLTAEELISLDDDTTGNGDPFRESIEEIAERHMNVENVKRSEHFLEMEKLAAQYFDLISKGKTSKEAEVKDLKGRLDDMELVYNNDPGFVALLKAERSSNGM